MFTSKLDQIVNFMIRPQRNSYQPSDLGPKTFKFANKLCYHQDFDVQFQYPQINSLYQPDTLDGIPTQTSIGNNDQSYTIKCSVFTPMDIANNSINKQSSTSNSSICVLAAHGNTGSRLSSIFLLSPILAHNLSLAIFDFLGCGNSDGNHITLGYYEKYQIPVVLQQLQKKFHFHRFILFGRSMGATSALLFTSSLYPQYLTNKQHKILTYYQQSLNYSKTTNKTTANNISIQNQVLLDIIQKLHHGQFGYQIIGLIMDSPYYDTKQMFIDIINHKLWFLPQFIVNYFMNTVDQKVKSKLSYLANQSTQQTPLQASVRKQKKIFSIIDDIKIPKQCQLPFPVYIIYGYYDNIISINHQCQLFTRLKCKHKKIYVIQNQSHSGYRHQSINSNAIQWIIGYQFQRFTQQLKKDSQLLGIPLNQYKCYINKYQQQILKQTSKSIAPSNKNQKSIQITPQRCKKRIQNSSYKKINQSLNTLSSFTTGDHNRSLFTQLYTQQISSNQSILYHHPKIFPIHTTHFHSQQNIITQYTNDQRKTQKNKKKIFLTKTIKTTPYQQLTFPIINNNTNQSQKKILNKIVKLKKIKSIKGQPQSQIQDLFQNS